MGLLIFFIDYIFSIYGEDVAFDMIKSNYIENGFCFHSFNNGFLEYIKNNGLIMNDKPWDNSDIEVVKDIYKKYGNNHIFGLYQGNNKTPLYFAKSLSSSSFYSYSSPTWFRHLCSGGMKSDDSLYDKNAFYNRDYEGCYINLINSMEGFSDEERNIVVNFFNVNYQVLGTNNEPSLILIYRSKVIKNKCEVDRLDNESLNNYIKRCVMMDCSGNVIVKKSISSDEFVIFNYDAGMYRDKII